MTCSGHFVHAWRPLVCGPGRAAMTRIHRASLFVLLLSSCSQSKDQGSGSVGQLRAALSSPPGQLTRLTPQDPSARVISFETGQVLPLALSSDRSILWAVNTPAQTVEAYAVTGKGLRHLQSTTVGVEPCAVAARGNGEA